MADLNMPSAATPWMHIALALKGEAEIAGKVHNPRIVEMFRVSGTPQFETDETAWCAADVGACLVMSGWQGTRSALASSYATFGSDLGGRPQYGCVVVFHPLTAGGSSGHVGFFLRDLGDKIEVISGNHSNKHDVGTFAKSKVRCYRWPTARLAQLPASDILPNILTLAPQDAPSWIRAPNAERPPAQVITVPAADNFARVHPWIAKWEGGFSNDPDDPGGATNFGITRERLSDARGREVSVQDVRELQYHEALAIFRRYYWEPLQCDRLQIALAAMAYNTGVNSGPHRGALFLQRALNKQGAGLEEDGDIGPLTITAAAKCPDIAQAVRDHAAIYEAFYRSLKTFSKFGDGWLNRLRDITSKALAVAGERVTTSGEKPVTDPAPAAPPPFDQDRFEASLNNFVDNFGKRLDERLAQFETSMLAALGKPVPALPSPTIKPIVEPPQITPIVPPAPTKPTAGDIFTNTTGVTPSTATVAGGGLGALATVGLMAADVVAPGSATGISMLLAAASAIFGGMLRKSTNNSNAQAQAATTQTQQVNLLSTIAGLLARQQPKGN